MEKLKDFARVIKHMPVGGITVYLLSVSPHLAWMVFLGFMAYELNEDRHLKDHAWKDIKGYLWGLVLVGVATQINILSFF